MEAVALSEDGQIMNWCYSQDEESAQKELLDRRKYPDGCVPIWVSNKEIDVGYKRALKKHEEVQYAKSTRKNGN